MYIQIHVCMLKQLMEKEAMTLHQGKEYVWVWRVARVRGSGVIIITKI